MPLVPTLTTKRSTAPPTLNESFTRRAQLEGLTEKTLQQLRKPIDELHRITSSTDRMLEPSRPRRPSGSDTPPAVSEVPSSRFGGSYLALPTGTRGTP